jgi:CsoR family transcriptional regulator, copper-sensing transcriptional repressor
MHQIPTKKAKALRLTKQAQGTLQKVIAMLENDTYCIDIIQQVDSAAGLLRTMKKELLAGHLDTCAIHQLKTDKKGAIEELLKVYNLSN